MEYAWPDKEPEDDDAWIRTSGARREALGQKLARGIVAGMDIDANSGIEHTEWVELAELLRNIAPFVGDKDEAANHDK